MKPQTLSEVHSLLELQGTGTLGSHPQRQRTRSKNHGPVTVRNEEAQAWGKLQTGQGSCGASLRTSAPNFPGTRATPTPGLDLRLLHPQGGRRDRRIQKLGLPPPGGEPTQDRTRCSGPELLPSEARGHPCLAPVVRTQHARHRDGPRVSAAEPWHLHLFPQQVPCGCGSCCSCGWAGGTEAPWRLPPTTHAALRFVLVAVGFFPAKPLTIACKLL